MDNHVLKFRIWVKSEKKMYNWAGNRDIIIQAIPQDGGDEWTDDCEVMQFTGLFGKNNVPIYEGDILKVKKYEDWDDMTGHDVVYQIGWCEIHCGWFTKGVTDGDWAGIELVDPEVIGNIFENPELFK